MVQYEKNVKKQNQVNIRLILAVLVGLSFLTAVTALTLIEVSGSKNVSNKVRNAQNKQKITETNSQKDNNGKDIVAVLKEINTDQKEIVLFDINLKEDLRIVYSGGSSILDKYNQVISIKQLPIGTMVDVNYDYTTDKLRELRISTKAWEYVGVNNFTINPVLRTVKIVDTKYKFTDQVVVLNDGNFGTMKELAAQDLLTIWGYKETIWSVKVTRGHGTVRLQDYEPFMGANITIGYESMQKITEDLVVTVREGNFNLTVENGKYSATKNITVLRNQETVVSLADIGPEAPKMSRIIFDITPFGADLYINGELTSYANAIEMPYGEHKVEVMLGGYTSYRGKLIIDEAGKLVKIELPEVNSRKEAEVSITDENPQAQTEEANVDNSNIWAGENSAREEEYIVDEDHVIFVQKPLGASVYLNGEFKGTSPVSFDKVIGTHVITFIKQGYETKSYTVEVLDDGLDTYFSLPDLNKIN